MASEVSIQIRIDAAIERLEQIAREQGINDEFPRNARGGLHMIRAIQLETVVGWVEQLLNKPHVVIEDAFVEAPKPAKKR